MSSGSNNEETVNFRFPGQYLDGETGLYYNRFRYYMPDEGIYTQRDPIGLAGGNPTVYGYVHDSLTWIDPLGLTCKNAKALRSGQDVRVSSFKDANRLLKQAFPNAKKVRGAGPKSGLRAIRQKKAFRLDNKRTPVYHKDYLRNPKDKHNSLFGHEDLPVGHAHKTTPHINILTSEGNKVTIFIDK